LRVLSDFFNDILKNTETLYNLVIENVIKEITEDPQMSSVSTEALDYLSRVWKNKLNESGVYTPHPTEFRGHVGNTMLPIRPSPGGNDYMAMNNPMMDPQRLATFYQQRFFPNFQQQYREDWIPPQGNPAEMQMFQGHYPNIMFDAKPTLASGAQHPMTPQMMQHYNMGMAMPQMNHPGNMNDKMQQNKKDPSKTTINIKGEDSEEQNNSKLPVKVPTNGDGKGLIDVSTGTPRTNATNETAGAATKAAEKDKKPQEEEKKDEANEEEEDNEREEDNAAPAEEDVDDADLFEYNVDERNDTIQTKEEHIPPPLQQNTAVQPTVNLSVTDLDPYNPQDRPLDSDDDPDYAETPDTTDILLAFHEKVHRHGSKWKVTLKQGIMNARGKEYILSQISGDFDFM